MIKELDIVLKNTDIGNLKLYCEKAMKGNITDQDWRDYQLDGLLGNTQTLKMNGYKEHSPNSITYVFSSNLIFGCLDYSGLETAFKHISHCIKSIRIVDDKPTASIKVLDTSVGKELKRIIEDDIRVELKPTTYRGRIFRLDI